MNRTALELARIVAVIALVCAAAAVATPKGRVPLALRGVLKILRKDRVLADAARDGEPRPVSLGKRLLGAALVLLALLLACIKL